MANDITEVPPFIKYDLSKTNKFKKKKKKRKKAIPHNKHIWKAVTRMDF